MNDLLKESRDELSAVSDKLFVEIYEQGYNAGLTARKENGCAFCNIDDAIRGLAERLRVPEVPVNQQRAELIRRAGAFVESNLNEQGRLKTHVIGLDLNYKVIINEEKRTVVILAFGFPDGSNVVRRGIAKCMPDEVFNADIGKAIALARALEIDIPQEFLNAIQPTEVVVGMVTIPQDDKAKFFKIDGRVPLIIKKIGNHNSVLRSNGRTVDKDHLVIIDDTNAEYKTNNEEEI